MDISQASAIYYGNSLASGVYYGSNKIWPTTHDYSQDYFTVEYLNACSIGFYKHYSQSTTLDLQYSLDNGQTWNTLVNGNYITPSMGAGTKILLKGNVSSSSRAGIGRFRAVDLTTSRFIVYGNIMSLVYGDNFIGQNSLSNNVTFNSLFEGCRCLQSAENLYFPPLVSAGQWAYRTIFNSCPELITGPKYLPNCHTSCSQVYEYMFANSTNLENTPIIDVYNPQPYQLADMFNGCSKVNFIECLSEFYLSSSFSNWVNRVASTGVFVCADNMKATWESHRGASGLPTDWTIYTKSEWEVLNS